MLDSPCCQCDVPGLAGPELSEPGGLTVQAVLVVASHGHHQVPGPLVRAPTWHQGSPPPSLHVEDCSEELLRQQSYAIKNQLVASKAPY